MKVPEYLRKKIMRRAKLAEEFNNLIGVIDIWQSRTFGGM